MSSRSFVSRLPLRHAFCSDGGTFSLTSDYTSFQLTFQSLLSTSGAGRILVYSYQLHFFAGSFWHSTVFPKVIQSGKGLSPSRIWFRCAAIRGCDDVRFFNQYLCIPSFPGAFQLGIFLHCIFTFSRLISTFSILFTFSNCFLLLFNYSACWLCSFIIV